MSNTEAVTITLEDIIKKIRSITKEIDQDFITSEDLTGWINEALNNISNFLEPEASAVIEVVEGQESYPLPDNVNEIKRLTINKERQRFIPFNTFNDEGAPVGSYTLWENEIIISTPKEDGLIKLYYFKKFPALKNLEDKVEIDDKYIDLIVFHGISMVYYKNEEFDKGREWQGRFEEKKVEMYLTKDKHEKSPIIRQQWRW